MRNTFVDAKSQQRPEDRWFVTGLPSRGIVTLKVCVSETRAARDEMMDVAGFAVKAETARRFCDSFVQHLEVNFGIYFNISL